MANLLLPFDLDSQAGKQSTAQLRVLKESELSGEPLSIALRNAGLNYDDLSYEIMGKRWAGGRPLSLEMLQRPDNGIPLVSFFSGCGGIDLGLEAAGFRHTAAFEINELFCKTIRKNRPNWSVFGPPTHSGDVSRFEEVAEKLRTLIPTPFEGVFVGGPPCQPFSIAANQRFARSDENFKRTGFAHEKNGNLLHDYIALIAAFKPAVFVIENVPGLRDLDGGVQLTSAVRMLEGSGYRVEQPFILDASQFGVAQQRYRLFVVGSRRPNTFQLPSPLTWTVGAGSVLAQSCAGLPNNETREHKAESVLRYAQLDYGERDQLGRVDRLNPLLPSKTVIAGGTNGGGRSHLHPDIPRTLSVRESARLQTFPDDYVFIGPTARQFTQVGNAVPPVLAAQVGAQLLKSYFGG